ncbi:MAG: hypothetical protein OXD40_01985 [bacterium]|nr:hypothetical protein [bacterium]
MANRKARAKRRAAEQREARERRRDEDRVLAARRALAAAGTAASRADRHPAIRQHDAAVLPLIRDLRQAQATWQEIADWLDEHAVSPPGVRAGYTGAGWSRTAVWRIARRHGIA